MKKIFLIDCLPESAQRYQRGWAIVAVDVIRATTMAITAASVGRKCFPVDSLDAAFRLAEQLDNPLLAGEVNGMMPVGFDINNSPAELSLRDDVFRPLVMLSSSGTKLMSNGGCCDAMYLACFRNCASLGGLLARGAHRKIALIGAGSRGEFREEDQIACAWVAKHLVQAGYHPGNAKTEEVLGKWQHAAPAECLISRSVDYLRRTDQLADLHFILNRINDLEDSFLLRNGEVVLGSRQERKWQPDLAIAEAV
jgi:Phosphosulfolactate phosphohydrolase and related enzymes